LGLRRGKKSKGDEAPLPMPQLPPPAGLPSPLPMPPGGNPLPPLPSPNAPIPAPLPAPAPLPTAPLPIPAPLPQATLPTASPPANDSRTTLSGIAEEKGYNDLWAKRSEKPLQQIYGHIDRISNKEAGSLLDRYADRFGHALDREIIVMRKAAMEEKVAEVRDAPVVELLQDEVPDDGMTELQRVEHELRTLKPLYQEAKALGDKEALAELTPTLQALMAQRKALKEGGAPSMETTVTTAKVSTDDDTLFARFVSIVDDLLGEHLPEAIVNDFVASSDFEVYRAVLESPNTTDESTRAQFYTMVDDQLGNMSSESIEAFVASPDFEVYRQIGEQYKDA
jgi:hypothetical protein